MFGYNMSTIYLVLLIIFITIIIPVWLARKLCALKGFNLNWSFFAILFPGLTFVIMGIKKARFDHQTDMQIRWSKISIIAGVILTIFQLFIILK